MISQPHTTKAFKEVAVKIAYLKEWVLHHTGSQNIGPEGSGFSEGWTATLVPATTTNRDKNSTPLASGGS